MRMMSNYVQKTAGLAVLLMLAAVAPVSAFAQDGSSDRDRAANNVYNDNARNAVNYPFVYDLYRY